MEVGYELLEIPSYFFFLFYITLYVHSVLSLEVYFLKLTPFIIAYYMTGNCT